MTSETLSDQGSFLAYLKHMKNEHTRLYALLVILNLVSWLASSSGLIIALGGWDELNGVNLFGALVLIGVIQGMIFVLQARLVSLTSWMSQPAVFVIGALIPFVFVSMTTASIAFGPLFRLDKMSFNNAFSDAVTKAEALLLRNRESFQELSAIAAELSVRSANLLKKEIEEGGTCGSSGNSPGPRSEYRSTVVNLLSAHSEVLSRHQKKFDELSEKVSRLRTASGDKTDTAMIASLTRMVNDANAAANGAQPVIQSFIADLARLDKEQSGISTFWHGRHYTFACSLPALSSTLAAVKRIRFVKIPVPQVLDTEDTGSAVLFAVGNSVSFITGKWDHIGIPEACSNLIGAVNEISALLLIWLMRSGSGRIQSNQRAKDELLIALSGKVPLHPWMRYVVMHGKKSRSGFTFYLPVQAEDSKVGRAVMTLESSGCCRFVKEVDRKQVPENCLGVKGEPPSRYRMYFMPSSLFIEHYVTWLNQSEEQERGDQCKGFEDMESFHQEADIKQAV